MGSHQEDERRAPEKDTRGVRSFSTPDARAGNSWPVDDEDHTMKRIHTALVASLAAAAAATALAAPAQADPSDQFLSDLAGAGLGDIDPGMATSVGQQVCPMLAEPGQQLADVAGEVSGALGRPLGPATMFTGLAITMFCPGAVASLANGDMPLPLDLLGI